MGCKILAIEYVYPDLKLTNKDLAMRFPDYDFEKFEKKVGIKHRYILRENETALGLAVNACEKLFGRYNRDSVDYLLYCTQSPEYVLPTTACVLQDKIGLRKDIGALDFNLGCSGYTYGISLAKGLINSGQAVNVLLVTAESYSKHINSMDRSNLSLFGDAATATLITLDKDEGIGEFKFGTDGSGYDKLIVKNGSTKHRYDTAAPLKSYGTNNHYTDNDLYMDGPEIFNFTGDVIPKFTEDVLLLNELERSDVSQFIFHQANAFMLKFMRNKLKINEERFYISLNNGGNTVSNTIPIALKDYTENKIQDGPEKILLMGFGVGLSWCGGLIYINSKL
ncbi:ketoacyl-ACP synthase III [Schleiferiaceae bacterium]|nr:ketoacyl-ACP synthase III [Schleiferiaceae bacterium]